MPRGDEVRPAPTPSVKFTYEDLLNFQDDGTRHEIISRERAGVLTEQHVRGAPDLVVEILSPGTRKTTPLLPGFAVSLAVVFASPL